MRLNGPVPIWNREDGGEAGLHPSNLHDYVYAVGSINLSGDLPIIIGKDGPSLGGFVCPITITESDLWKVGQLRPGHKVRFNAVSHKQAIDQLVQLRDHLALPHKTPFQTLEGDVNPTDDSIFDAILHTIGECGEGRPQVVYRRSGDSMILVEYGECELDLELRSRVHVLMDKLKGCDTFTELCPGVRSLLVGFDNLETTLNGALQELILAEDEIGSTLDINIPSRIIHLPLCFDDPWNQEALTMYTKSVRSQAPWLPSNIEFVRRINGLSSVEDVKNIMEQASYLVLGLGDVYLGAPCAVALDPRHRIVTSKYNPARTYTPEGSVGLGGAYLCIYGMQSPGGYQLVGRTLPIWDKFENIPFHNKGLGSGLNDPKPWLLRFFDQVRFFMVTPDEIEMMRSQFREGRYKIKTEESYFCLKEYNQFLQDNKVEIAEFKASTQESFNEERERWVNEGVDIIEEIERSSSTDVEKVSLPEGSEFVVSPFSAKIWSINVTKGQNVSEDDVLFTLDAMKTQIPICAPNDGTVIDIQVVEGQIVEQGTNCIVFCNILEERKIGD